MKEKSVIHEKMGGRRLPLYAEVGKYFSPDGAFQESIFRQSIRESLEIIQNQYGKEDFSEKASDWISSYLSDIIDYLGEKGMSEVSLELLKTATEESLRMGLDKISISANHLENILSGISAKSAENRKEKSLSGDEKRKKIFDAALQVFAQDGFYRATIDKIASISGVGKGSVYRYFKSKNDLLNQLLIEKYQEIVDRFNQIYSKEFNLLEQVQEMIVFWVKYISDNHLLYRLMQNEAICLKSGERVMLYEYITSHLPMFKERIVSLNYDKKLKTTNFFTVFYGILGFIDGVARKWFRCGMDYPLMDEVPIILEVLFNGFVGEKETHRKYFISPEGGETDD